MGPLGRAFRDPMYALKIKIISNLCLMRQGQKVRWPLCLMPGRDPAVHKKLCIEHPLLCIPALDEPARKRPIPAMNRKSRGPTLSLTPKAESPIVRLRKKEPASSHHQRLISAVSMADRGSSMVSTSERGCSSRVAWLNFIGSRWRFGK